MAEIRTVTTLRSKRDEIAASIDAYERKLAQARADLAHVEAIIRIFAASGERREMPRYVDVFRLFRRFEKWAICRDILAKHGELSTRELAKHVMAVKGFDPRDGVLAITVANKLCQTLRCQERKSRVAMVGKRQGVCVWRLPSISR